MFKRIVFAIGFFYTSLGFAGTMGALELPCNGFYIGGDVGVADFIDKQATLTDSGTVDTRKLSAIGFVGGGMLGYDFRMAERFKLGVEGFINAASGMNVTAFQLYEPVSAFTAHLNYYTGARILPAYELSPGILGHLVLGYSYGNFNLKDDGDFGFIHKGVHSNGFQGGLGIELPGFCKNLSLRGDILYTHYGSLTTIGQFAASAAPPFSSAPLPYFNSFATFEGNLSLIYKFI